MKSKTGLIFVVIFIVVIIGVDIYGNICSGDTYCGLVMLPFSFPWILFMEFIPSNFGLYLAQVINIIPIYFIGAILGKLGSLFIRS